MKNKVSRKKVFIVLGSVFITIIVLVVLYTLPSKWISFTDEKIISIDIQEFTKDKKTTITDQDDICEILQMIRSTRTKYRQPFPHDEDLDLTDSGFYLTFYFENGETEQVSYSFMKNGLIDLSPEWQNISFENKKLCELLLKHLGMDGE